jgi:cell division topological specificity factor
MERKNKGETPVLSSIRKFFFGSNKKSKNVAKNRLHFVLVQDRAGLTNEEMALFKKEILNVIEKYFVVDKQAFDIAYKRDVETTTLIINSPVIVNRKSAPAGEVGAKNRRDKNLVKGKGSSQGSSIATNS